MYKSLRKNLPKISLSLFVVFILLILPMFQVQQTVKAQGTLTLSTAFPGVTVKPGETIEFPLKVIGSGLPSRVVELSVESMPQGWSGFFEGDGRVIHRVFASTPGSDEEELEGLDDLYFKVQVPSEVSEGSYKINLKATGQGASDTLTLDLAVSEETHVSGKLVAQYQKLEGPSSAIFNFRVSLTNQSSKERTYSLGANVPEGWEVSFIPAYEQDQRQVASISLEPGRTQQFDVQVKPAKQTKAGTYDIPIAAQSPEETLTSELQLVITGTYEMTLTTPTGRLNAEAHAGKEQTVTLNIKNEGSADLKDISFNSSEPQNWSVTFSPDKVDSLAAGETQQIKAIIKPDSKAIAGDYVVKLTANTTETQSETELRVMVKTPTTWGIVGVIIILIIVVGLLYIFRVFGRR
ncbi:MAG TPA: alpha-galactosidase [Clostridiales bacterium]|nr:alpha-galactosidase [Clostridiales bacterium]